MPARRPMRWLWWLIAAGAAVVVLAVGGTFAPSFGSFVTTDDHGVLEFLLNFVK